MAPDGQTDGKMDGPRARRMDGHGQSFIPPPKGLIVIYIFSLSDMKFGPGVT